MNLVWSSNFKRSIKKIIRLTPHKKEKLLFTLSLLQQDPFKQQLHTHKLRGDLKNCWACFVEYDIRIVFTFVENSISKQRDILLLDIGSHDEVY